MASGAVRCEVKRTFKLADAATAHRALGDRETTGSSFTVLCAIAAVYFTINYSISLGGAVLERKFAYVH